MEQVAAVAGRISELRALTAPGTAAPGFAQVLQQRLAASPQGAVGGATDSVVPTQTANASVALGHWLNQQPTDAAAPTGAVGAATAAPAPGGDLVMPVDGRVSSNFGPRIHPITGKSRMHSGIDIAAPTGTPIQAAAGGVVSFAGVKGGYGNTVIIDHPDGSQTLYAHKHTIGVRDGERVDAGEVIGTVGSTGQSTGPHLHFEIRRDGEAQDPRGPLGLS